VTDLLGRPAVLRLTPGNIADITAADELLEAAGPVQHLVADKGYDANRLRKLLKRQGAKAVIPSRSDRKAAIRHDQRRYRDHWSHRGRLLPHQGLPQDRHALRQTRAQLPLCRNPRNDHRVLGLIESRP